MMDAKPQKTSMLFYLSIMTGFFLLMQLSFFIQCNSTYLGDFKFISDQIHIPASILPGVMFFILAQLGLHGIFTLLVWLLFLAIVYLFQIPQHRHFSWGIAIWCVAVFYLVVANQYYLPNSKFAELTSLVLQNHLSTDIVFGLLSGLMGLIIVSALAGAMLSAYHHANKVGIYSLPLLAVMLSALLLYMSKPHPIPSVVASKQPNVIIIGIDSLRPDYLSFFGSDVKTPFMDAFLNQSTVFAEAVTPLARTFPSWTGIFTGQYPRDTKVRFNLAQQVNVNLEYALGSIFKRHGYNTIFATDETRFSNIDKNFGFDQIIAPPMGLNDFLIGTFNDFPLSNLVINTRIVQWLFPYSYANRPVFFAYDPNSFNRLLTKQIKPSQQPVFLSVHFCLPHNPYLWKKLSGFDYNPWQRYAASIARVDRQVADFYTWLNQQHMLDHAVVILLSDHGEALEMSGDRITEAATFISASHKAPPRFYPPSLDDEGVNQSGGHGTDVLGLSQYHSLLAIQLHGLGKQQPSVVPGIVSLLDIKPTLLDLLGFSAPRTSGISLAAAIKNPRHSVSVKRHIFLESDFSPAAIRTVYPQAEKVLLDGIELFQIDAKTTRLTVKTSMGQMIVRSKQYADIYQNWMLALYPQDAKNHRMPILINLMTGEWTNDLHTSFAIQSPAQTMLQNLQAFYGQDLS